VLSTGGGCICYDACPSGALIIGSLSAHYRRIIGALSAHERSIHTLFAFAVAVAVAVAVAFAFALFLCFIALAATPVL
jgi:hypothetical protein